MKKLFSILFFGIVTLGFSQKKEVKKFETSLNNIEIFTKGLDDISIEKSSSSFIEVSLWDEENRAYQVNAEEISSILKIDFIAEMEIKEGEVFRKFITKRLKRARVVIKIPAYKSITVLGTNVNVTSKNYQGDLKIYIDKGDVRLGEHNGNVEIKTFLGNISGAILKSDIHIISNKGNIEIDGVKFEKNYQKEVEKSTLKFVVNSINANVMLTTLKTQ